MVARSNRMREGTESTSLIPLIPHRSGDARSLPGHCEVFPASRSAAGLGR